MTTYEINPTTAALDTTDADEASAASELTACLQDAIVNIASEIEANLTAHRGTDLDDERKSDYLVEYHTSRFLGIQCWFANQELTKTRNSIELMAKSLAAKVKNFNGSEVAEIAIGRLADQVRDREAQLTVLESIADAAGAAYEMMTGKQYQTGAKNKAVTQTAVSMDAAALAAKYAKPEPETNARKDSQPESYTDESGQRWEYDADTGSYKLAA
jgi:hypothetical protein